MDRRKLIRLEELLRGDLQHLQYFIDRITPGNLELEPGQHSYLHMRRRYREIQLEQVQLLVRGKTIAFWPRW